MTTEEENKANALNAAVEAANKAIDELIALEEKLNDEIDAIGNNAAGAGRATNAAENAEIDKRTKAIEQAQDLRVTLTNATFETVNPSCIPSFPPAL